MASGFAGGCRAGSRSWIRRHSRRSRDATPRGSKPCTRASAFSTTPSGSSRFSRDLLERRPQIAVLVDVADDLLGRRCARRPSTTVSRSCSSRWSASEVVVPTKFSNRVSSCSSCWTRVRSSGGPKMTSEMSNGRSGAGSPTSGGGPSGVASARGLASASRRPRPARLGAGRLVGRGLLEERVLLELLLEELLQLHRGELQEVDRLLQHRRHDEPLRLAEGEAGFHGHRRDP